jgi:hypothetical protein
LGKGAVRPADQGFDVLNLLLIIEGKQSEIIERAREVTRNCKGSFGQGGTFKGAIAVVAQLGGKE